MNIFNCMYYIPWSGFRLFITPFLQFGQHLLKKRVATTNASKSSPRLSKDTSQRRELHEEISKSDKSDGKDGFIKDEAICVAGKDEASCVAGKDEASCVAGKDEASCVAGKDEASCVAGKDEASCVAGKDQASCVAGKDQASCVAGKDEASCVAGKDEASCVAGKDEASCVAGKDEASCVAGKDEANSCDSGYSSLSAQPDKKGSCDLSSSGSHWPSAAIGFI